MPSLTLGNDGRLSTFEKKIHFSSLTIKFHDKIYNDKDIPIHKDSLLFYYFRWEIGCKNFCRLQHCIGRPVLRTGNMQNFFPVLQIRDHFEGFGDFSRLVATHNGAHILINLNQARVY